MTSASEKIVTIIGGSGFIGRYITRRLAKAGYRIRIAVRRPDLAIYMQPAGGVGQIFPIQTNVRYPNSVEAAVKGADYVINLAGILDESKKQTFKAVNVDGIETVAKLCSKHNITKLIHFSALNAAPKTKVDDADSFLNSNFEGETKLLAAFPSATIVRPSLVFGPEDRLFNIIAHFAKLKHFIAPVFGDLDAKSEPVYVDDIAKAVVKIIEEDHCARIFEFGGPTALTMLDIAKQTLHASNRDIKIIGMPSFVSNMFSAFCTMLPYSWITRGEVRLFSTDQLVSEAAKTAGNTLEGLGIKPTPSDEAITQYLQHYRPEGDYGLHDVQQKIEN